MNFPYTNILINIFCKEGEFDDFPFRVHCTHKKEVMNAHDTYIDRLGNKIQHAEGSNVSFCYFLQKLFFYNTETQKSTETFVSTGKIVKGPPPFFGKTFPYLVRKSHKILWPKNIQNVAMPTLIVVLPLFRVYFVCFVNFFFP